MRRLLLIAGTRPELIKLAPLIAEVRRDPNPRAEVTLAFTGQHDELAREVLTLFGIKPAVDLKAMEAGTGLSELASRILVRLPAVLADVRPDVVVVQGDTTSTFAASVAAFHARVPLAHVEAGLRSHRMDAPFPEEANRRMVSLLASYHFAPTEAARQHLLAEGVERTRVWVTGNTIVDALGEIRSRGLPLPAEVQSGLREPFVLVTMHRRESIGGGLDRICDALIDAGRRHPDLQFVLPVHKNPDVERTVRSRLSGVPGVVLVPPLGYAALLGLLARCAFVMTDSGGVQEEAPSFGKYCLVLRDVTERREGVDQGVAVLAGTDPARIRRGFDELRRRSGQPAFPPNPYGDGHAARRIIDVLEGA